MALLSFHEVGMHFGAAEVLSGISLAIEPGMKIGLVGENGSGKSTLLRLATGELTADTGRLEQARGLRMACMEQLPQYPAGSLAIDLALTARPRLAELRRRCRQLEQAAAEDSAAALEYAEAVAGYEALGGYSFESDVRRVLDGLGLDEASLSRPPEQLSGGEGARLALARALLSEADLLLLDEPDNHLDLAGIRWLEQSLRDYSGTLVIVSHDRELLDHVVDSVIELEDATARLEHGGLAEYFERKRLQHERQKVLYLEQQKRVQRLRADISRIEQSARSMEHMSTNDHWRRIAKKVAKTAVVRKQKLTRELEGEQAVARPQERGRIGLSVGDAGRGSRSLLWVEELSLAYGERLILDSVNLRLERGQRIAITGGNGCGKTSLLDGLVGELEPLGGRVWLAGSAELFYCDQQQAGLDPQLSLYEQLEQSSPLTANQIHYLLARIGLKGRADQLVGSLSGGEHTRLLLSVLMNTHADLLVLDEPSNHLDLPSIEVLQEALLGFSGGVLLVSHDRRLVANVATEVYELRGGRLLPVQ